MSDVLWLVVVWILWMAIATLVFTMVRWSMRGQQEAATENEADIIAARKAAGLTEPEGSRWSLGGPPMSAT